MSVEGPYPVTECNADEENSRPLYFPRAFNGSPALGLVDKNLFSRTKGDFRTERKRFPCCIYTRVVSGCCLSGIALVGEEVAMVLTQRYHIATAECLQ